MIMEKGLIFALSGPSGVGKGTVGTELRSKHKDIELSISATTRSPRDGEVNGREYYFISQDNFDKLIEEDAFVEYVRKFENSYGTLKSEIKRITEKGNSVLLDIEPVGALNIKKLFPEAVLIFLIPQSLADLQKRLWSRGSETLETFEKRKADHILELDLAPKYDYVVLNRTNNVEYAVNDIERIIEAEKNGIHLAEYFSENASQKIEIIKAGGRIC